MFCAKSELPGRLTLRRQQMSIRNRLTLRYVVVLGFTLLAYGIIVNVLLVWNVYSLIDRDLAAEARELYPMLDLSRGFSLAEQPVTLPDVSQTLSPDTLVQVIDRDGQVVAYSFNVGRQPLLYGKQAFEHVEAGQPTYVTIERNELWLRVHLVPVVEEGRVIGLLWVARSLETLGEALDRLQALLAGVGLLALLSAGAWGWMLARSSLRPVGDLTRAAYDISQAQDFSQRVAYSGPPDEIGRLAATFNEMLTSLQAAHQYTESVLAAQRRFVADASHELRTPLTSLRGNVGILRHALSRLPAAPADTAGILADMDDELARLSRLVDGLLTLARADAGQHIATARVDLSEIVRSVFRHVQSWPSQTVLHLDSQDRVIVSGSSDHLTQLLLILLDNAIAYTPPGGQVTLSLKREGDDAVLGVTDTGIGMDLDDLPYIFDRFYRGRAARVARGEGAGLGLAIARWIVDEHGGQIAVSSEVGRGSSFTIRIPALSPP